MLLDSHVVVKVKNSDIKYYENLGYIVPRYIDKQKRLKVKRGTEIIVNINDLLPNSGALINIKCDYNGDNCKGVYQISYFQYLLSKKDIVNKDCCEKCKGLKIKESNLITYKVDHVSKIPEIAKKISNNTKHDYEFIKEEFNKKNYILISKEYVDANTFLEYICKKHINEGIQKITYGNLSQNHGCYYCGKESRGEKQIRYFLQENNINFKSQYKFSDCKDKNMLSFDFAIFFEDGTLNCLIEYDGEQHFMPITFGGMSKEKALIKYNNDLKKDDIKNTYCINNNIKLIRIPYWEFNNIELLLSREFNLVS